MPFGLPDPTTSDARERFQKAAETEIRLNAEALAKGVALKLANEGMDSFITGLPPPISAGAKTLSEGVYAVLKARSIPIDIERAKAQMPGITEKQIDPVKLFALMIAFAIIQALWCFIKSILHPLPIIGWFFSLCDEDPPKIKDRNGNLVDDDDQKTLNNANKTFTEQNPSVSAPAPIDPVPQPINIPQPSAGKTFSEFMAEKYPAVSATNQNGSGVPNLVPSAQNTQGQQAQQQQPQTPITYEDGNLSSDQARRLFGL
jgi:hypothetical protein